MKNTDKKEWAKIIYLAGGISQKDVAAKVGVSLKTINTWAVKEKWDELRTQLIITREEQLKRFYHQVRELNDSILLREEGKRYANSKEADTLTKLTVAIKNLEQETSLSEVISVFQDFTNYIHIRDLDLAQKVIVHMDGFVKYKIK